MITALLASASLLSFSATPAPVDELPLAEWGERADGLSPLAFRYRMVNPEGETGTIDIAVESPERATLIYRADGLTVWFTVYDGVSSQIVQSADGPPAGTTIDLNAVNAEPLAWLTETLDSLDFPQHSMTAARMYISIWPTQEGEGTWSLNMGCGVSDEPKFLWLAELGDAEFEAERVDDTYVVRLASGAELTLDAEFGFLRGAVIDPENEAAGSIELLHLDLDPDMDAEPFGYEVPEEAQVELDDAALEASAQFMWEVYRERVIRLIVEAEADEPDWLKGYHEVVVERFGTLNTTRYASQITGFVELLEPEVDRMVDKLAAWYEENKDSNDIEEGVEASKEQIRAALRRECKRGGEQIATSVVVSPFGLDDETLTEFLKFEHEAAAEAMGAALLQPLLEYAQERFDGLDDG